METTQSSTIEPPAGVAIPDSVQEMKNPVDAVCTKCNQRFRYDSIVYFENFVWTQDKCDTCLEKEEELRHQEEEERKRNEAAIELERKWERIAPPRYRVSDKNHPGFRRGLFAEVMKWTPSEEKPWLGLVGEKGCCKTRIALMRTRAEWEKFHKASFLFVPIYTYAEAVRDQYAADGSEERHKARELLSAARKAEWLILDDVGKARNTPAVVESLFALLDHRHSYNLVTLWTANNPPEEFCEGMAEDVAGPLVRRLNETSTLIAAR